MHNAGHWPYQPQDRPSTARDSGRHLTPFDEGTSTRADYVALLFNLKADIGERENLIGSRTDVARRLRPLLAAWHAEVDAGRTPPVRP